MDTPIIDKPTFAERFIKPVLKLLIALIMAFVGSSVAGIALCFIIFAIIFIIGILKGELGNPVGSIIMLPIASAFFTLLYGILAPIFSAIQIIIFGVPIVFIAWKFKLIRWWTSLLGGFLLAVSPWALLHSMVTALRSSTGFFSSSSEMVTTMVAFWVLGSCGSVGGLCFWLTLRLLRFPDIVGSNYFPQLSKQGS